MPAVKYLRKKKDGSYEGIAYDGGKATVDASLKPETARKMWAQGGYDEVDDTDFEALRRLVSPEDENAEADFRAGASKFAASGTAGAKGGPVKWAEDDFRAGAPKVGREDGYGDAKRDGFSNPAARPDMTAMDGPRNPNPMPRAGMKKGRGTPSLAVGMPAADRAGAGRLPTASAAPRAAQKALPASTEAEVTRAVDPYGEARATANRNRLGAQLGRAGAMVNEALSGARYERGAYDDLEAQAEQPVVDFAARREMGREDATDAATLEERRLRAEDYARRWASGDRDFQYKQGRDKTEDARRAAQDAEDARRFSLQQRNAAADRAQRERERTDRRADMEAGRNDRAAEARAATLSGQREKSLAQLAERSQPAAEMRADIDTVNGFIQKGGDDFDALPGVGPIQGNLPEFLRSTDGDRLFQSANRLAANVILAKSGKAATDAERKVLLSNYGIRNGTTEEAFIAGMQALARDAQESLRNIESGYDSSVVDTRRERGGTTSGDIPQIQGPAAGPKPTGRTITMPDGRVFDVLDNGKARPRG